MDVPFVRVLALTALALLATPQWSAAEQADDQYAVAAGHYSQGRWQLALDEFRSFLAEHPGHAKAHQARFFVGESLVQMRQFATAAEQFQELVDAEPEKDLARKALFRAGESSYFAGRLDDARRDLQKFQERYGDDRLNAYVFAYLGDATLEKGDAPAADALFARGLERFPQGPLADECRFGLARTKEQQGHREEAQQMFMALAAKPSSEWADDAQFRLGGSQLAAGDYAAAIATFAAFDAAFAKSAWKSHAELGRAQALYRQDKLAEARLLLQSLTAHDSLGLEARYWLGLTHEAEREYAQAVTLLLAASKDADKAKHPLAAAMVLHAADALLASGKTVEASREFARLLKAWPTSDLADDALLGQTRAALATGDHKAVEANATEFHKRFTKSDLAPVVQETQARSLLARGDFANAEKLLAPTASSAGETSLASRILLGLALQGQQRHEDVLKTIAPALVSNNSKSQADALRLQATALMALNRFGETIAPLEAWLTNHATDDGAVQARAQLALSQARAGRFDAARSSFGDLIKQHPKDELVLPTTAALAETALAAEQRDWAKELFAALAADGNPPAYVAKGLAGTAWGQFQGGQLDESAAAWLRLIERFPDDPLAAEAALVRGQILEQQQKLDAALEMFRRVIDRHATSKFVASALLGAARVEDRLKHHEAAAKLYERLADEFPNLPECDAVLYNRGWVLRELGQTAEADQQFEELHTKHAKSRYWPDAVYRLAERALQAGQRQRAKTLLEELLAAKPAGEIRAHALYLSAQVAIADQAWDAAMKPLEQLAQEFPESPLRTMADFWRAEAAYRHADYDDASKRFAVLAKQPGGGETWRAMVPLRQSQLLAQQKKWDEAKALAEVIATRYPNFDQQYEADYLVGRCLAGQGKFDEAREFYRRAIRSPQGTKTETAAMAQWMVGESFFHQKNYEAAVREFLRLEILYAFPKWQAAALLEAGKCHEFLGEWPQAIELYARLLKTYPSETYAEEASRRLQTARARSK